MSTTRQAFYATLLIQSKLASALVDSGSSVSLASWNILQSLGFVGVLEVYKGKILRANTTAMPVKRKAKLIVQLEKFAPEFGAALLLSTVDTFHCLVGLAFLIENDCIFCAKEKNSSVGRYAKPYH